MDYVYTIAKDTERYAQLEQLLVHIAAENKIDNVSKVAINLSEAEGIIQFKEASESYDDMAIESTDGIIIHTIEADKSNPNVVPKAHIKLPQEALAEMSKQGKFIRVNDEGFDSAAAPTYGLQILLKEAENFTSFVPVGQHDRGAPTKDITAQCQIDLV